HRGGVRPGTGDNLPSRAANVLLTHASASFRIAKVKAAAPREESSGAGAPRGSSWTVESPGTLLIILATINFLNYVDRYVIAGMAPLIEKEFGLSGMATGSLQTAFMIVHSMASIPLGYLADRILRKRLIAVGVGIWSLATAVAGVAASYLQLLAA